ncbi:MAG: tetratricopeptide repeat protein [Methylomicrobium sp.]
MASNNKNALTLSLLLAPLFLIACNSLPITPHDDSNNLDDSSNILNMLDPDIRNEEQAFAKGQAALQEGKPENALFYFVKTLQFNKNNVKALEKIASIHEHGKHPEFAIKAYHDILAVNDHNALANEKLGLYYLDKGQDGKAKPYLLQAIKNDKRRWKSYNGLGVIADLERNTEEAINYYQSALAIMPNTPMLLNNLGYSYYLNGDELKARELFNQALNFDTQYKRAIHNLALIEIKSGEFISAAMLFNRIMSPHESYNNIGYIALLSGQYDVAEEYLRRAIDECPVYFPKAQQNLKNLLAAKASNMPYQPTSEEVQQIAPAPEIQSDIPPEPSVNVKPAQSSAKIVHAEKPAPQNITAITSKSADKKNPKYTIIKAQQVAAQPAKKKTQPEIKQIAKSKAALSNPPQDRAPAPLPSQPSTTSVQTEVKSAGQDQKPAEPNLFPAPPKAEESKAETAQSIQLIPSQAAENTPPAVLVERPISSLQQPVASPNSGEAVQPPPLLVEEQKKIVEPSAQAEALPSPVTSVKTAAPEPVQQQPAMAEGNPSASGSLQTMNEGQPAITPKTELHVPPAPSSSEPKKQEAEIPQKVETLTPLMPVNSFKKNDVFVTDIAVDK